MTESTYTHIYTSYGDEVWVRYKGPCGQQKPTSYSVISADMKLDLSAEIKRLADVEITLSTALVDWRDEVWKCFKPEENSSMYSKAAIKEAYDFIDEARRAGEIEEILERFLAWGEDEYAAGTVFRFNKEFTKEAVNSSFGIARDFEAKTYTYATIKLPSGAWASSGCTQFGNWDAFVKFLVTEGEPVIKEDVEIFPPAVFPARDNANAA